MSDTQTGHVPTQLEQAIVEVIRLARMVDDFSELQAAIKRLEALLK